MLFVYSFVAFQFFVMLKKFLQKLAVDFESKKQNTVLKDKAMLYDEKLKRLQNPRSRSTIRNLGRMDKTNDLSILTIRLCVESGLACGFHCNPIIPVQHWQIFHHVFAQIQLQILKF